MDYDKIMFELELEFCKKFFSSDIKISYEQGKDIFSDNELSNIVYAVAKSNFRLSPELQKIAVKIDKITEDNMRLGDRWHEFVAKHCDYGSIYFSSDTIGKTLLSYEDCFDYPNFICYVKSYFITHESKNQGLKLQNMTIEESLKVAKFWISIGGTVEAEFFKRLKANSKIDKSLVNELFELNGRNKYSH